MGLLDDDLAFMLADQVSLTGQGVVRWRGKKLNGTFDHEQRLVPDGSGDMREKTVQVLIVATADVPTGAAREDAITVDGADFKVRSIEPRGDGRHTEVIIANA